MRILLDECLPRDLKNYLPAHERATVSEMGWAGVKNGQLLNLAEQHFDVFLTADRNIEHQQNMRNRRIVLVVPISPDNKLETLAELMPDLDKALQEITPGVVTHVPGLE